MSDFTGTWRLSLRESSFGFLPPAKLRVDSITQTEAQICIVTRQVDTNGDHTVERVLPLNGTPVEVLVLAKVRTISARWDGDVLLIETHNEVSGRVRRIEDRWSLSADGESITVSRSHDNPGGAVRQKIVLQREALFQP